MSNDYRHFNEKLEWETLEDDNEITHLVFKNGVYNLPENCIIQFIRGDDNKLQGQIRGVISSREELEPLKQYKLGDFIESEIVSGTSGFSTFELSGFVIGHTSFKFLTADLTSISFTSDIFIDSIIKKSLYNNDSDKLCEWYLGSKTDILFPRSTQRRLYQKKVKLRNDIDERYDPKTEKYVIPAPEILSGFSRDFFIVDCNDLKFIVAQVPKEFGPSWSGNICIE